MPSILFASAAIASLSLGALIAAAPAFAAAIETPSRVDSVIVFPDAAMVTRVAEVEIPAGAASLIFKGLPMALDPASLRIEGSGGAPIQIGSVETRVAPAQQEAQEGSLGERLRKLVAEREMTQARIATLQARKNMIERYAQASPERLGDKSAPLDVEKWAAAWDAVAEGLGKLAEENQTLRQRLADVEQEIRAVQASNRTPAQRAQPSREVSVDLEAQGATKARFVLVYRVAGAGWQPLYDARLETRGDAKPVMHLVRRAQISQRSGEDWNNVELSVSTVRVQRGAQAPDVLAQRLRIYEPPPIGIARPAARSAAPGRPDNALVAGAMAPAAPAPAEAPREETAREREATLEAGAYEAQFRIPGRIDVPSDGSTRALRIASQRIEPIISVRASPSIDTTAYLEIAFVNREEAPILPGEVNIHRDGTYVGRSAFRLIAPGEDAKLGFGADERVKITRVPVSRRENAATWLGSNRTERQDFRTTVRNLHPFPVKIAIVDRIPISEDAAIVIEPLSTNTAPTEKSVEERRGVMAWTFDLAPNATREIRLGWQVRWPKDKRLIVESLPDNASR